jgi:hypothetical protein
MVNSKSYPARASTSLWNWLISISFKIVLQWVEIPVLAELLAIYGWIGGKKLVGRDSRLQNPRHGVAIQGLGKNQSMSAPALSGIGQPEAHDAAAANHQ